MVVCLMSSLLNMGTVFAASLYHPYNQLKKQYLHRLLFVHFTSDHREHRVGWKHLLKSYRAGYGLVELTASLITVITSCYCRRPEERKHAKVRKKG